MKIDRAWTLGRRTIIAVATLVAAVGMGCVLAVSLAGRFGDVALGMKTGSMRPAINPGDLILVNAIQPKNVRVGDIITFQRPGEADEIFTHRVAKISYSDAAIAFETKGDANKTADTWTVTYSGPAWRLAHTIRHGGIVLHVAQGNSSRRIIAASVFVIVLALMWPVIVGEPSARPAAPVVAGDAA